MVRPYYTAVFSANPCTATQSQATQGVSRLRHQADLCSAEAMVGGASVAPSWVFGAAIASVPMQLAELLVATSN